MRHGNAGERGKRETRGADDLLVRVVVRVLIMVVLLSVVLLGILLLLGVWLLQGLP